MVTYSTNWMGPVSIEWYKDRGLVEFIWKTAETEEVADMYRIDVGEKYMVQEITTYYACGRIDIREDGKEGYDGWDEYSLAPMHGEDWNALSDFLRDLTTDHVIGYNELIEMFENHYGKKIRWME